jgi:hypothetical protein
MRNQGRHDSYDDEAYWDGVDRRNGNIESDRRQNRHSADMPSAPYWQYPPQYPQIQPMIPSAPAQISTEASKNIANSSLTLSQLGGIVIVLGSIAVSLFSAWSGLNKEIDTQKNLLEQFKQQIGRDVSILEKNIQELKSINSSMQIDNKTREETLEKRIQDLDSTISQIYQKVNRQ